MISHFEHFLGALHPPAEQDKETFAWLTGIPDPSFNIVTHLQSERSKLEQTVDRLIQQAPLGIFPWFWVHRENRAEGLAEVLAMRNYQPITRFPVMMAKVEKTEPPQLEVRHGDVDLFVSIFEHPFQSTPIQSQTWRQWLKHPKMECYIVYLGGEPAGTGVLFPDGDFGVISHIATQDRYRRMGCAKAMMLFLMNRAHLMNLKFLILGASPMSQQLYSDLGFNQQFDVTVYAHP